MKRETVKYRGVEYQVNMYIPAGQNHRTFLPLDAWKDNAMTRLAHNSVSVHERSKSVERVILKSPPNSLERPFLVVARSEVIPVKDENKS